MGFGLTEYFREEGLRVETGAKVHRVSVRADGMKVVHFTQDGEEREVAAHEIFYALGRVPNVCGMDLDNAGVDVLVLCGQQNVSFATGARAPAADHMRASWWRA